MKGLIDYIFEQMSNDRLNLINYLKDESNKIREKDIQRAANVLINMDPELFDYFKKEVFNGNEESMKALFSELEHKHLKASFIQMFNDKENLPTLNDLLNNDDILDLFKDKFKDIPDKEEIFKIILKISTRDKGGKGVGKGEIFLNTFIKGANKGKNSDITIENMSFEVKASDKSKNGGRIIGNNNVVKDPKEIVNYLSDVYGYEYYLHNKVIGGYKVMNELCNSILQEEDDLDLKDDIFVSFANGYYYQFFGDILKTPNEQAEKYIEKVKNTVNKNNIGEKLISEIHAIFALISYKETDKWDKLIVINTDTLKYHVLDSNIVSFDKIDELADECSKYFVFKNGPSSTKGANKQNYVSDIYLK